MAQRTFEDNLREVRKMRIFATSLLIIVTSLFFLSLQLSDTSFRSLLRAFSEAAMVGALADWFAVTALFRRPLGLPIPHTAILPRNKDRIGENFGAFVERNFLNADLINNKLEGSDIAHSVSSWVSKKENAEFVVEKLASIIPPLLETVSEREINEVLYEGISKQIESIEIAPFLGKGLELVLDGDRHKLLSNELLNILGQLVEENKLLIKRKVREESPWFIPDFIDTKIYEKIISQLRALLLEIKNNPTHHLRAHFASKIREFVSGLTTQPEYREIGEIIKRELLSSPEVKEGFLGFCRDLKDRFSLDIVVKDSIIQKRFVAVLIGIAQVITRDAELRRKINYWIRSGIVAILNQHSHQIAAFISETVKRWDSSTLVDKFELEIGKDLQFIRINGTLVGGFIGVLIWIAEQYAK